MPILTVAVLAGASTVAAAVVHRRCRLHLEALLRRACSCAPCAKGHGAPCLEVLQQGSWMTGSERP